MSKNLDGKVALVTGYGRGDTPEEAAGAVYLFRQPESDYVSAQAVLCTSGVTRV